ncbi:MAG: ferritin [Bacillus subtilis]|nr:ferritin [Bacillus subtilis]
MLNKKVAELLNQQINKEMYSAYLYLDFANFFIDHGLVGFGNWYNVQAQEEMSHAKLFIKYLQNNAVPVELEAIAKPGIELNDIRTPLVEAFVHEEFVTASIYAIYEAALQAKDYRTQQFLQWFIKEQGEEEKNANDLILQYDMYGQDKASLLQLDIYLGKRKFSEPDVELD